MLRAVLGRPRIVAEDRHVVTLYRYFLWADRMRVRMEDALAAGLPRALVSRSGDELFLWTSYYHAALYIVIEGWQRKDGLGLTDTHVDQLLTSENVELLRRFRNATFHFQREYLDQRVMDLVGTEGVEEWMRALRDAFADWFDRFFTAAEARHPKGEGSV